MGRGLRLELDFLSDLLRLASACLRLFATRSLWHDILVQEMLSTGDVGSGGREGEGYGPIDALTGFGKDKLFDAVLTMPTFEALGMVAFFTRAAAQGHFMVSLDNELRQNHGSRTHTMASVVMGRRQNVQL